MIDLTSPRGLFPSLAAADGILAAVNATRGATVPTAAAAALAQLADDPESLPPLLAALAGFPAGGDDLAAAVQDLVVATLLRAVNSDPDRRVGVASTTDAVRAVIAAMTAQGLAVRANLVGMGLQREGTPAGDPVIVVASRDGLGRPTQLQAAEYLGLACTGDAASGTAQLGAEPLVLRGYAAPASRLAASWPGPSGTALVLTAVDPARGLARSGGTLAAGGDFETWTAGVPDGWTVVAGGAQLASGTPAYSGSAALAITGDGSSLPALRQALPGAGAATTLRPGTAYALVFWAAGPSTAPTSGVLEVALVDAGSGATLNDGSGNPARQTWDLTVAAPDPAAFGPTYAPCLAVLRTPATLPAAGVALALRLTQPLSSGATIRLDRLVLTPMVVPYAGGPGLAVVSGATPLSVGDAWEVSTGNDRLGRWQTLFDRYFGLSGAGLLLPTTPSGSSLDALLGP